MISVDGRRKTQEDCRHGNMETKAEGALQLRCRQYKHLSTNQTFTQSHPTLGAKPSYCTCLSRYVGASLYLGLNVSYLQNQLAIMSSFTARSSSHMSLRLELTNGGRGGDVYILHDQLLTTLSSFPLRARGNAGRHGIRHVREGTPIILRVTSRHRHARAPA